VRAGSLKVLFVFVGLFATLGLGGTGAMRAATPPALYVGGVDCSDAYSRLQASSPLTPWCSIGRAMSSVVPGDFVLVAPGRYFEAPALHRSGTSDAPIVFSADGAVIDAGEQTTGLTLNGVSDVRFQGLAVTNASSIGVWIGTSQRIEFVGADVYGNGSGIKIKDSTSITVRQSSVHDNASAGIMELGTTTKDTLYEGDTISRNGFSSDVYNGDGIQLASQGAVVRNCTITNNGSSNLYEHGIYASAVATGYLIDSNQFDGNSGASVKAAGEGAIINNIFGASRLGSYVGDSSGSGAYYAGNSFLGPFSAQAILIGPTGWATFGDGNSGLPAPLSTAAPRVSGTPQQGQTLTTTSGSWATFTLPVIIAYQWQRCDSTGSNCSDIADATSPTYVLGSLDVGWRLRSRVTATTAGGSALAYSALLSRCKRAG